MKKGTFLANRDPMSVLGFVILSHEPRSEPLRRLVSRLNQILDFPPIVCHHDFHKAALDTAGFSENVTFVENPVQTNWADISLVRALLLGLHTLYKNSSPEWFTWLSTRDYPIRSGNAIEKELKNSEYDVYLDHRLISDATLPNCRGDGDFHLGYDRPSWTAKAFDRYVARVLEYPMINRKGKRTVRRLPLRHPSLRGATPFHDGFQCFAGDAWFTARRKCAEILLADTPERIDLMAYYWNRTVPDESYCHTLLCNSAGLRICSDNKRFTDWIKGGDHPKTLTLEDLPHMLNSTAHFARKFDPVISAGLFDELDRLTTADRLTTR